jgi:hypothetical protein
MIANEAVLIKLVKVLIFTPWRRPTERWANLIVQFVQRRVHGSLQKWGLPTPDDRRIYVQFATNSKSQKLLKVPLIILRQHATAYKSTLYIMAGRSLKNEGF